MNSQACVRSLFCCLLLLTFGYAQQSGPARQLYPPTLWVPCDMEGPPKELVAGPPLVSRAGEYSAKVTVALALQKGTCFNTTSLWVEDPGSSPGQTGPIFVYRPQSEYNSGSGMNLVDWSPDGQLLLAEFWQWNQQPNDEGIDKRILLFSADGRTKLEIDTDRFWADQKGKNCQLEFKLLGFTPSGQVALRTDIATYYEPGDEPSDVPPAKRCTEKHQTWAVDPHTQHREPLPQDFHAQPYSLAQQGTDRAEPQP